MKKAIILAVAVVLGFAAMFKVGREVGWWELSTSLGSRLTPVVHCGKGFTPLSTNNEVFFCVHDGSFRTPALSTSSEAQP